jgi:hypothetical protein
MYRFRIASLRALDLPSVIIRLGYGNGTGVGMLQSLSVLKASRCLVPDLNRRYILAWGVSSVYIGLVICVKLQQFLKEMLQSD